MLSVSPHHVNQFILSIFLVYMLTYQKICFSYKKLNFSISFTRINLNAILHLLKKVILKTDFNLKVCCTLNQILNENRITKFILLFYFPCFISKKIFSNWYFVLPRFAKILNFINSLFDKDRCRNMSHYFSF